MVVARAGSVDAMEPDDAWYAEPRIRVTGPSVRDISLYPEGEGARLLREDLAFRRKSVGNEAGFRRLMRAMHKRQEKTPVAALRGHIQRTSRERIARALDPETVRRRASWTDSSASAARYKHAHREDSPKISPAPPERPEYPTPRRVPEQGAEEGAEEGTPRGTMMTDGMRHLPEGFEPATAESRERRLARQLARTLGKVIAPHASWEGAGPRLEPRRGR